MRVCVNSQVNREKSFKPDVAGHRSEIEALTDSAVDIVECMSLCMCACNRNITTRIRNKKSQRESFIVHPH